MISSDFSNAYTPSSSASSSSCKEEFNHAIMEREETRHKFSDDISAGTPLLRDIFIVKGVLLRFSFLDCRDGFVPLGMISQAA
jgi:hypothetical protein